MDNLDLGSLNYLAIIVAVIVNQAVGAGWYSAFAKPWVEEVGLTTEDMEAMRGTSRQWRPYIVAIVSTLIFTLALAMIIQGMGAENFAEGLFLGLLAAAGFILTTNATNYSFEGRSLRLYLINSGYPLIMYSVIGILLTVWQ
jgi:type III secretory pathway component EscS